MNSLTVNSPADGELLPADAARHAILIEDSAFPSDSYAVRSQAAFHGYDPDEAVIRLAPRPGEACCAPMTCWISCARTPAASP